jgi:DNA helicase-2/ATP-dependent DNA helicase PcrA
VPQLAEKLDFWNFVSSSFKWFEHLPEIGPESSERMAEFEEEKLTWQSLVNEVVGQYGREQLTLNALLQELDLRSKTPSPPKNAVPCFTIHGSKGMEFNHVYLVGMVEDQLPSWAAVKKGDNSREMQEERRNCFVAITRAQESLTLTYSRQVFGWPKEPSRFLNEMALLR